MPVWSQRRRLCVSFVAGSLCVLAMPPYNIWLALLPSLSLFYIFFCTATSPLKSFFEGWAFSFGYFLFGLIWIGNALLVEGNIFSWVWPLAVAGLPALLALFYGLATLTLYMLVEKRDSLAGWMGFIGIIAFTEWLRGHLFTGFPWNLWGYVWSETLTIAQSASLFGIYGLTLLTIAVSVLPALWWMQLGTRKTRLSISGAMALLMLGLFLFGFTRLSQPMDLKANVMLRIVQPNITQTDKWNPLKTSENFSKILSLSISHGDNIGAANFLVWPETAVTENFLLQPSATAALKSVLQTYNGPVYLATGMLKVHPNEGSPLYYNSLTTFDQNVRPVAEYDKSHLVPFGEYIPFKNIIPLEPIVKFSGFEQGSGPQTQNIDNILKISPLVCYEIIFPGAVTARTDSRPDLLVNVTNDAWYGDSAGPRQHLAMTRFRSIEEGLPAVRSANTGISAIYDSYGQLLESIPLNQAGSINSLLPQSLPSTIYTYAGDLIFFIFVIALVLPCFRAQIIKYRFANSQPILKDKT